MSHVGHYLTLHVGGPASGWRLSTEAQVSAGQRLNVTAMQTGPT